MRRIECGIRKDCCFKPGYWAAILGMILGGLFFSPAAWADQEITLAWDPDTTGTVFGYYVYIGTSSGDYTSRIDVGPNPSATITNLQPGTTYYFAVAAYNDAAQSPPSSEISYITPGVIELYPTGPDSNSPMLIAFPVAPNHWYEVQSSSDLIAWYPVYSTGIESANGWDGFQDPRVGMSKQYYRLLQH